MRVIGGMWPECPAAISRGGAFLRNGHFRFHPSPPSSSTRLITGAFQEGYPGFAERGLGKLANREIAVTEKGLRIIEEHMTRFDPDPANAAMMRRLRYILASGERARGADAIFYLHEIYESTLMKRGMPYRIAHDAALERYGVSAYSVYHPEVIRANPGRFNINWYDFWEEMARRGINP